MGAGEILQTERTPKTLEFKGSNFLCYIGIKKKKKRLLECVANTVD